ncbi:hypothetical protein FNJ62_09870 [Streptomyces benahoarensis]|uniref:Uncharacterized protein n=1 Tax=Streptomyces benahoarensis TaxID=2595054 RepID=A0A553ZP86_9ACTN|nr:hypothetical protein FNJ62_09870 [Streptomyces benahoarensis]TSB43278.1 hypothetical protein FNZ23_05450 [Streptomyces benahoarensis]
MGTTTGDSWTNHRHAGSEATRLLCAGSYLSPDFRRQVVDELVAHEERTVAPSLPERPRLVDAAQRTEPRRPVGLLVRAGVPGHVAGPLRLRPPAHQLHGRAAVFGPPEAERPAQGERHPPHARVLGTQRPLLGSRPVLARRYRCRGVPAADRVCRVGAPGAGDPDPARRARQGDVPSPEPGGPWSPTAEFRAVPPATAVHRA